jgi:hypothetical protein
MRHTNTIQILICSLIIAAGPLCGEAKMQVRDGRPVVDGVYVNGHGPYRFLLDTGANVNLIETGIARKIGMSATFQVDLASSAGETQTSGSDGNEVALDGVKAHAQRFLFSGLEAIHGSSPDIHGVLGQWFLAQFDYTLNLRGKRIEFGKIEPGKEAGSRTRTRFHKINARPVISTSLGVLALDSGANRLVLFGVRPDSGPDARGELRTVAGSQQVGIVSSKSLVIEGRKFWGGDAVAMPSRTEPGVNGLLPLGLFKSIYFCNSESYVVFE